MSSIRIISYNVHMWQDADGHGNTDDVANALSILNADIICLQEVFHMPKDSKLTRVASKLGYHLFFGLAESFFGNAILTRYPIIGEAITVELCNKNASASTIATAPMDEWLAMQRRESRSALFVMLQLPNNIAINVCCTHLDHQWEPHRLLQLSVLLEHARIHRVDIICGDFNSIRLADYSLRCQRELTKIRSLFRLEPPCNDVVAAIDAAHFIDCWRFLRAYEVRHGREFEHGVPDIYSSTPAVELDAYIASLSDDALAVDEGAMVKTVWAKTRIDFIWLARQTLYKDKRLLPIRMHVARDCYASDHYPVVLDAKLG